MGVAQLASVPHLGCGGRGFESHHPYIRKLTATVNTLVDTLVRIQYCRFSEISIVVMQTFLQLPNVDKEIKKKIKKKYKYEYL